MKDVNPYESPASEVKALDHVVNNRTTPKKAFLWTILIYESTIILLMIARCLIYGMVHEAYPLDYFLFALLFPGIPLFIVAAMFLPVPWGEADFTELDLMYMFICGLFASFTVACIVALISYVNSNAIRYRNPENRSQS